MADAPKRAHDPPTGQTPGKKQPKRRSTTSGRFLKRSLFSNAEKERNVKVEKDRNVKVEKDQKVRSAIILYQVVKYINVLLGFLKFFSHHIVSNIIYIVLVVIYNIQF